jgi:hypothetical protein
VLDRRGDDRALFAYPRLLNNRMVSMLVNWSGVMADQIPIQSSEAQVRSVVEAWAKAMRAKDADGVVAHWVDDLVQFDLAPPLRIVGDDPRDSRTGSPAGEARSALRSRSFASPPANTSRFAMRWST